MKIVIPEEVIQKASKCNKDFRCLTGKEGSLCRIIRYLRDDMYFVKYLDSKDCPFLEPHKKTALCNCPVRHEIFHSYKI